MSLSLNCFLFSFLLPSCNVLHDPWNPPFPPQFCLFGMTSQIGGIGIPNFFKYYRAVHLLRVVDWHFDSKQWLAMDIEDAPIPLLASPCLTSLLQEDTRGHPLIGAILAVVRSTFCTTDLSQLPSPLTPIIRNPDLIPGPTSRGTRYLEHYSTFSADFSERTLYTSWFHCFWILVYEGETLYAYTVFAVYLSDRKCWCTPWHLFAIGKLI